MLIELFRTVLCLILCFTITSSYINIKSSERTLKKQYSSPVSINNNNYNNNYYKQSRYSKFDKVMTRINKMNVVDDGIYKIRHKGWSNKKIVTTTPSTTTSTTTETDLFETYGDLVGDEEFDDYEDTLDDEEEDLDYENEEDNQFFDQIDEDVQAEEPTSTSLPRMVSKFTEYKWNQFGTREAVEESMRQQINLNPSKEQLKVKAIIDHYTRVTQQSKCLRPLPRVIPVQQEHPDPTRSYTPACTVLHRCAEDSGCCKRDTKCQYKTRVLVPLYFYAKIIGQDHNTIQKLEFYNHTECECKERNEYIPDENQKEPDIENSSQYSDLDYQNGTQTNIKKCNCPKPYQSTTLLSKCICDCDKNDEDCIQLKKGKEHFSMTNRICIQDNQCGLPSCEYGAYMITAGKCPTKQDKLEGFRKMRINN